MEQVIGVEGEIPASLVPASVCADSQCIGSDSLCKNLGAVLHELAERAESAETKDWIGWSIRRRLTIDKIAELTVAR